MASMWGRVARVVAMVALAGGAAAMGRAQEAEPDEAMVVAVALAVDDDDEQPADRAEEAYEEGTDALDEEQWDRAVASFDQVLRLGGPRAEGALYWKAYAQAKSGRNSEAMSSIGELRRKAPQSRWLNEAQALEMEIRQSSGQPVRPEAAGDEELKLIALNSLMAADSARALPMLEGFLSSRSSRRLRDKALFVLTQSEEPRARAIVLDVARGRRHPELQRSAVKYLGLFGGSQSRQALSEIYGSTSDAIIKKEVLHSFMVAGDKAQVLQAAQSEKAPELRRSAIQLLGAMGAQDELWQMYRSEASLDVKKHILHGMFVGGAEERLTELARTEKEPELRRAVIHNLGLMGSERTAGMLVSIYQSDSDARIRREAVNGLFIQGNADALVKLARAEKDQAMRREIVSKLALMDSKVATDYMMELLK